MTPTPSLVKTSLKESSCIRQNSDKTVMCNFAGISFKKVSGNMGKGVYREKHGQGCIQSLIIVFLDILGIV